MFIPTIRRDELTQLAARSHQTAILATYIGAITGFVVAFRIVIEVGLDHMLKPRLWLISVMPRFALLTAFAVPRHIDGTARLAGDGGLPVPTIPRLSSAATPN